MGPAGAAAGGRRGDHGGRPPALVLQGPAADEVPGDDGRQDHKPRQGHQAQSGIGHAADPDRGAQGVVAVGVIGLEAGDGGVAGEPQGLGIGADVADGEGPARQVLQVLGLDGLHIGRPDAGEGGDVLDAQAPGGPDRPEGRPDVLPGLEVRRGGTRGRRLQALSFAFL